MQHRYGNSRSHLCFICPSLKNVSPADAYQKFCIIFRGYETLTHLTLQGNDQNNMLPPLCEVLRHPKCNLKYLRYVLPLLRTLSIQTELLHTYPAILCKLGWEGNRLFYWKQYHLGHMFQNRK